MAENSKPTSAEHEFAPLVQADQIPHMIELVEEWQRKTRTWRKNRNTLPPQWPFTLVRTAELLTILNNALTEAATTVYDIMENEHGPGGVDTAEQNKSRFLESAVENG